MSDYKIYYLYIWYNKRLYWSSSLEHPYCKYLKRIMKEYGFTYQKNVEVKDLHDSWHNCKYGKYKEFTIIALPDTILPVEKFGFTPHEFSICFCTGPMGEGTELCICEELNLNSVIDFYTRGK